MLPFRTIPRANRLGLAILAPLMAAVVVLGLRPSAFSPGEPRADVASAAVHPRLLLADGGSISSTPRSGSSGRSSSSTAGSVSWLGAGDFARSAPRAVLEFLEVSLRLVLPDAARGGWWPSSWSARRGQPIGTGASCSWPNWRATVCCPGSGRGHRGSSIRGARCRPRHVLVRRLNLEIVRESSTRANTFPSGHAAGRPSRRRWRWAEVWPLAGAVFFAVAFEHHGRIGRRRVPLCRGRRDGRRHRGRGVGDSSLLIGV